MLPLLEATASATTATHPPLSTAYRRLTTARIRSGSTAKARGGYKEALKRSDRLALVSERLRPGTADAPYPHPVWRFRSPHHFCSESEMRTSEPKPHWINKLLEPISKLPTAVDPI